MKKALIFDIDGTLWDASTAATQGFNAWLWVLWIQQQIVENDLRSVTGRPFRDAVDMLSPGVWEQSPHIYDVIASWIHQSLKTTGGEFYPGVVDWLIELSEYYKIFLISNCQEEYLHTFLSFLWIRRKIKDIDCNGMSWLGKAAMIENMIKKHRLRGALYIWDTSGDEQASLDAGVEFLHVWYGFWTRTTEGPSFESFSDLVDFLKKRISYIS